MSRNTNQPVTASWCKWYGKLGQSTGLPDLTLKQPLADAETIPAPQRETFVTRKSIPEDVSRASRQLPKKRASPFWSKGSFLRESIPNLQGPSIPLDWTIFQSDLCTSAALCLGVFALLFPQPGIPVPLSAHAGQIPGPLKPSSVMGRFQKTVLPPSTTPSGTW